MSEAKETPRFPVPENRVLLEGSLKYDPALTYERSGDAQCRFQLLTLSPEETGLSENFEFSVYLEGTRAEPVSKLLKASDTVIVEGYLSRDTDLPRSPIYVWAWTVTKTLGIGREGVEL